MDFVKIICEYFLLPALLAIFMFYFGKYRERTSKNNTHDKAIFDRIDSIINSQDVADIVHDAQQGYLAMATHTKSDDLFYFNNNVANQFVDKKLQQLYMGFDDALHKLSALYASSQAVRISLFGSLRALKDTSFAMLASALGFWIIPVPVGYVLYQSGLGGVGIWWGMTCGAACSAILLNRRYRKKIRNIQALEREVS